VFKDKIISQLVFFLLKRDSKFRIETDTSEHAIERVLFQEQDGKWRSIALLSRIIQLVERNYKIYTKKLLVIVGALTK